MNPSNEDQRNPPNTTGRFYWRKPDSMRAVALNDPSGKKNLGSRSIPCFKLRGMWMQAAGIEVGTEVTVELVPGSITLRVVDARSAPEIKVRRAIPTASPSM